MSPDFDREERYRVRRWSPSLHSRCGAVERRVVRDLLLHVETRYSGIGALGRELLVQCVLPHLEVKVYD